MLRGDWPEVVTRVTLLPVLEATHRSSPLTECRKAICLPSGEMAAESAAMLLARSTRRWMSSQSIS